MKRTCVFMLALVLLLSTVLLSGCGASTPEPTAEEITIAELCKEDAESFEKAPVSISYTKADEQPIEINDAEAASSILKLLLGTEVSSQGEQVDMYWANYEDYCFDFGDAEYTICIIPDSYVSYKGAYYEIVGSNLGKVRSMIEDAAALPGPETEADFTPVSVWYEEAAVLDTTFYDNGDEARSYLELSLSCSEGTLEGAIEGAYDLISIDRHPDCYIITYTYGDFYSHEAQRQSRITVESGELLIEALD